jgi:DNA-binding winged helix-turn-helix (wHTH) protein
MFYLYKNDQQEPYKNKIMTPLGHRYFYDTAVRNLYYKSFPIKLSPKEKRMLELLIDAKHNIVAYQTLEYDIWEGNVVSESALRTLMYRLNTRLEYKIIENVPTFGYRLRQE